MFDEATQLRKEGLPIERVVFYQPDDGVLVDIDTKAALKTVPFRLTGREATQDVH